MPPTTAHAGGADDGGAQAGPAGPGSRQLVPQSSGGALQCQGDITAFFRPAPKRQCSAPAGLQQPQVQPVADSGMDSTQPVADSGKEAANESSGAVLPDVHSAGAAIAAAAPIVTGGAAAVPPAGNLESKRPPALLRMPSSGPSLQEALSSGSAGSPCSQQQQGEEVQDRQQQPAQQPSAPPSPAGRWTLEARLVGRRHQGARAQSVVLSASSVLALRREPDNQADVNAIQVRVAKAFLQPGRGVYTLLMPAPRASQCMYSHLVCLQMYELCALQCTSNVFHHPTVAGRPGGLCH